MTSHQQIPTQRPPAAVQALRLALWAVLNSDQVTTDQMVRTAVAFERLNDVTPPYPPIDVNPTGESDFDVWALALRRLREAADAATEIDESARIAAVADELLEPDPR